MAAFSWNPPTYSSWNKWTKRIEELTSDCESITVNAHGLYEIPMSDQEVIGWICWEPETVEDLLMDYNRAISNRGVDVQEIARQREQLTLVCAQVFANTRTLAKDLAREGTTRENSGGLIRQQRELLDVAYRIKNALKLGAG